MCDITACRVLTPHIKTPLQNSTKPAKQGSSFSTMNYSNLYIITETLTGNRRLKSFIIVKTLTRFSYTPKSARVNFSKTVHSI